MGVEPPFLYDHPSRYSFTSPTEKGFNPKAASQASWTPRDPRPKHEGPLINAGEINRHPDSYFIVPYGNLNWKPMSPRTKSKVKYIRWIQLCLRICALLGALGMSVCVICIKGTDDTLGWIIRVPPGVALLHLVYSIYHLSRSSNRRPPASSASYMLFAAVIDVGLIPFFVFTAMMSHAQYTKPVDTDGRWRTVFGNDPDNQKILFSTFLFSVVNGSFHLISLVLCIYLAMIFRKISKLPPDMNPLEDNLTSRHKRNKSSLSVGPIEAGKNRDSHLSAPLMDSSRTVPFMHTRTESYTSISSPTRRPASSHRVSRTDLPSPVYQQPPSHRSSRANISRSPNQSPTKHTSMYADSRPPSTRPASTRSPSARPQSAHPSISSSNWFAYPSPSPSPDHTSPVQHPPELEHLRIPNYNPQFLNSDRLTPRPLEMNPPTPCQSSFSRPRTLTPGTGNQRKSQTPYIEEDSGFAYLHEHSRPSTTVIINENYTEAQNQKPKHSPRPSVSQRDSFGTAGGKARFYGDLYGSVGVKGGQGQGQARVVSSGHDAGMKGNLRGREVSGKKIEEGRAERMGMGMGMAF